MKNRVADLSNDLVQRHVSDETPIVVPEPEVERST
jgi:hypothetical protein